MEFTVQEPFHIMDKLILKVRSHMDLDSLSIKTNNTMKVLSIWAKLNQFTDGTKKTKERVNKESISNLPVTETATT